MICLGYCYSSTISLYLLKTFVVRSSGSSVCVFVLQNELIVILDSTRGARTGGSHLGIRRRVERARSSYRSSMSPTHALGTILKETLKVVCF